MFTSLFHKIWLILKRKETIIILIIIIAGILYYLFLKPNPQIRVNLNQFQPADKNSVMSLQIPSEINGVGKEFDAVVEIDTNGYFVNAIQAHLVYDNRAVQVQSMNTNDSFCKFYIENSFDNDKGKINLSCGSPYPGFRGKNNVLKIRFLTKAIKSTEIRITDDSLILANDGKGTNLLKEYPNAEVKIKAVL